MFLEIGKTTYLVHSVEEAVKIFEAERSASGEGASTWPDGFICEGKTPFARISYNGRVWDMDGGVY
jgi:hypothetical protein